MVAWRTRDCQRYCGRCVDVVRSVWCAFGVPLVDWRLDTEGTLDYLSPEMIEGKVRLWRAIGAHDCACATITVAHELDPVAAAHSTARPLDVVGPRPHGGYLGVGGAVLRIPRWAAAVRGPCI